MIENYKTFDYDLIRNAPQEKRKRGNQRTTRRRIYKSIVSAFDIETSRIDDVQSIMYIWQFQAGPDHTVIGRSWKECFRFFRQLAAQCEKDEYIVIFIHNASFEFQYLRTYYLFKPEEVFATGPRTILKFDMFDHLEFRCSYLHSNMSLSAFLKQLQVEDQKLSGDEFNYDEARYPWTPLTDRQLEYCIHDVKGLVQAIIKEMEKDGDNLYTLPLTSTGYVRRDVKKAMRELSPHYIRSILPDWDIYLMLREAFRGGNVHGNRYFSGYVVPGVKGEDEASAYPSAECNNRFPTGRFRIDKNATKERLQELINKGKAVLARIGLWNVQLKDPMWGCPYIPFDKCRNVVNPHFDNGRILDAEYLEITVTDIDLKIILSEYNFRLDVIDLAYTKYGWLPDPLIDVIERYFKNKTQLKGSDDPDDLYMYARDKAKLNSIYGMSAQNPVRVPMLFDNSAPESVRFDSKKWGPALLDDYNKKAFFPYQWGVWCTAIARFRLEEGLILAHYTPGAHFIYCDTDSVKYTGSIDWSKYNQERILDAEASLAYADDRNGMRHYMGVYERDSDYVKFATRGSKKYAYTTKCKYYSADNPQCAGCNDGPLHITIAGVNKKTGAQELEAAGGIDAFLQPVFTFSKGETETVYIDHKKGWTGINGHRLRLTPCATIRPSHKTLSDTEDYMDLLKDSRAFYDFMLDKYRPI